ncbi:MAG: bifunctional nuclease family protein [candidate division Zixibacteria bacterium]|nr:bifunctional nuclease family protein [candidate division Zixibacteria bacterium]
MVRSYSESKKGSSTMEMVKAVINGLALDITTNSPVVILTPENSEKILPIWIGHYEAWAIGMELSGVTSKRPLTHDLLASVITSIHGSVDRIEITELKEQTFYAAIYIKDGKEVVRIDARPSDSIALALKSKSPIFVNNELFSLSPEQKESQGLPANEESLKERLKRINPEDFGKYSL